VDSTDKSGKVKFTFEMELNQQVMELIRQDIDMIMDLASQGADIWRKNMGMRRRGIGGSTMTENKYNQIKENLK
jgi:hypothetical protein